MGKPLKYIPEIGKKYRDWTVISEEIHNKPSNRATYWKVRCKCGFEDFRSAAHLVNLNSGSCKSCSKSILPFVILTISYLP